MILRFKALKILCLTATLAFCLAARAQEAPAEAAQEPNPLAVDDDIVQAVLETEPSGPSQLVRAASVLVDLHREQAARALLRRLLESAPGDEALALLAEQFGSAKFVGMSAAAALQPEGRELAERVLQASRAKAQDPARIAAAIESVDAPSFDERRMAQRQIRSAGTAAASAAIAILADDERRQLHAAAKRALALLGPQAVDPLTAALEAPETMLKRNAVDSLAAIGDSGAAVYLLAPAATRAEDESLQRAAQKALERLLGRVPSTAEALELLLQRATALYERPDNDPLAEPATVQIWNWDATQRTVVKETVDARLAEVERCARLARAANAINPASRVARRLYLLSRLESAMRRSEPGEALPSGPGSAWDEAREFGIAAIVDALDYAIDKRRPLAAVAAARLLGTFGNAEVLRPVGGKPSPLVTALAHTDDRLRFASLEAVMALKPRGRFAGSSYVPRALEYFASARGAPVVLVAERRADEASRLAELLVEMGYEVEITTNGRDLARRAKASADVEMVLLGMTLDRPTPAETLAELRRDVRTAALPVGLIATLDRLARTERSARRWPLTWALVRPHDVDGMTVVTRPLRAVAKRNLPSRDQRMRYAAKSLDWLAELAQDPRQPFELEAMGPSLIAALYTSELNGPAISALSWTNTPAAQRALVELASRVAQPIDVREAAAGAFRESIRRYKILLSTTEILRQYDRYNQSEVEDRKTQEILSSILDSLEERTFATRQGSSTLESPSQGEELR